MNKCLSIGIALAAFAQQASAAIIVRIQENGPDLAVNSSGTLNSQVCTFLGLPVTSNFNGIGPSSGELAFGAVGSSQAQCLGVTILPTTGFGTAASELSAASNSGVSYFFEPGAGFWGPSGWDSNTAMTASMTVPATSFASAGLTPGNYVYTLTNGSVSDTLTIIIGNSTAIAPVAVTGYNQDSIAEAVPAAATTTAVLDNAGYVMYSAAYGLDPSIDTGLGLPDNGLIVNGSRTYQLQPYTANNVLAVTSSGPATLTLATPRSYDSINLLGFSTEGDTSATFTLHFTDSSNTTFSNVAVLDWFNNACAAMLSGFDRTLRSTDKPDNDITQPSLCTYDLQLQPTDQLKQLTAIDVTNNSFGTYLDIVAVSGAMSDEIFVDGFGH